MTGTEALQTGFKTGSRNLFALAVQLAAEIACACVAGLFIVVPVVMVLVLALGRNLGDLTANAEGARELFESLRGAPVPALAASVLFALAGVLMAYALTVFLRVGTLGMLREDLVGGKPNDLSAFFGAGRAYFGRGLAISLAGLPPSLVVVALLLPLLMWFARLRSAGDAGAMMLGIIVLAAAVLAAVFVLLLIWLWVFHATAALVHADGTISESLDASRRHVVQKAGPVAVVVLAFAGIGLLLACCCAPLTMIENKMSASQGGLRAAGVFLMLARTTVENVVFTAVGLYLSASLFVLFHAEHPVAVPQPETPEPPAA